MNADYLTYIPSDVQTAEAWFDETFPEHTMIEKLAEAFNLWEVETKYNTIFNRLVLDNIVDHCVTILTKNGDLIRHKDLTVEVISANAYARICNNLLVRMKADKDSHRFREFHMWHDPNRSSWWGVGVFGDVGNANRTRELQISWLERVQETGRTYSLSSL